MNAFGSMSGPRRLLVGALLVLLLILDLKALLGTVLIDARFAVDMEIPLRAAERWLAGQPPYLASAFASEPGATQPFLYPPYVLPVFAALTELPRVFVDTVAVLGMLLAAIVGCRRLGIPWLGLPVVLTWPPFAEAIFGANVQMLLFAAFVFLFYKLAADRWHPTDRNMGAPEESDLQVGGLAVAVGAVKVSQVHAWLYALRHRPRAAIGGAIAAGLLVAATLPLTGTDLWFSWLDQLRLASDTTWDLGGFAIPRFLPAGVGYVVVIGCFVAVWFVPRARAGAWVGVLSVIGSLSLHVFGLLFLVPAMLFIRLEAALMAAIFIATYSYEGAWAGILTCFAALVVIEVAFAPRPQSTSAFGTQVERVAEDQTALDST
jgi:hypothetical protein